MCRFDSFFITYSDSYNQSPEYVANVLFYPISEILDFDVLVGYEGVVDIKATPYLAGENVAPVDIESYLNNMLLDYRYYRAKAKKEPYNISSITDFSMYFFGNENDICITKIVKKLRSALGHLFTIHVEQYGEETEIRIAPINYYTDHFEHIVDENAEIIFDLAKEMICEWIFGENNVQ